MYPILFKLGPINIYTYGVMIALGIVAGLYFAIRRADKEGINQSQIIDLVFCLIISGFIGARITYILTEWDYFLEHPLKVLFAKEGFVFYGGFIFSFLCGLLYAKRKGLNIWKTADILAPPTAIAHAMGRLGCFFYGCCYGKPTNSFIGITFPPESPAGFSGLARIPAQLIEAAVLSLIFLFLIFIRRYKKFDGQVFWLYVLLYATARFFIEFLRADERGFIGVLSTSQFIAVFMAIAAIAMLLKPRGGRHF